jgi:hypothetical protein
MARSKKKKGCASKAKKSNEENCPYCLQWVPSLDTHLKYVNGNCCAQLEYDAQPVENVDVPFDTSVPPPVLERAIQAEAGDIELEESDGEATDELDIPRPSDDDWGGGADGGCLDDASMVFIQNGLHAQHLTNASVSNEEDDDEGYVGDGDDVAADLRYRRRSMLKRRLRSSDHSSKTGSHKSGRGVLMGSVCSGGGRGGGSAGNSSSGV